jgi:hypothetical protein
MRNSPHSVRISESLLEEGITYLKSKGFILAEHFSPSGLLQAQGGCYGISQDKARDILRNYGDFRVLDIYVKSGDNGRWYIDKTMISIWD